MKYGCNLVTIAQLINTFLADLGKLADLNRGIVLFGVWSERWRQRRKLAALDDHMLNGLALSRADVERECRKPFCWK